MLHALKALCCHGMNYAASKTVYQAVVISRVVRRQCLMGVHRCSLQCQRIDAFLRRRIRAGFSDKNMSAMSDLIEDADDALFERAMRDKHHVLHHPDHKTELKYDLRPCRHEFTLSQKRWTPVRL